MPEPLYGTYYEDGEVIHFSYLSEYDIRWLAERNPQNIYFVEEDELPSPEALQILRDKLTEE